jgi:hypothetical protein
LAGSIATMRSVSERSLVTVCCGPLFRLPESTALGRSAGSNRRDILLQRDYRLAHLVGSVKMVADCISTTRKAISEFALTPQPCPLRVGLAFDQRAASTCSADSSPPSTAAKGEDREQSGSCGLKVSCRPPPTPRLLRRAPAACNSLQRSVCGVYACGKTPLVAISPVPGCASRINLSCSHCTSSWRTTGNQKDVRSQD